MFTVCFVGGGHIVRRLPEIFARNNVKIVMFGVQNNPISESPYIDEYVGLSNLLTDTWGDVVLRNTDRILETNADWYIIDGDETATRLANSELSVKHKFKLLPCGNQVGLKVLGSKAGLAKLSKEVDFGFPSSSVAETHSELETELNIWDGPLYIKGDQGGGGLKVRFFAEANEVRSAEIPKDWFPLVLQQQVLGKLISVEALFWQGEIRGWLYSEGIEFAGSYGPTTTRRYINPPRLDFLNHLEVLGQVAELHGLFNCSFVWQVNELKHYLFEADPRPNLWHQFGPNLGVDWIEIIQNDGLIVAQKNLPDKGFELSLYPRELVYLIQSGKVRLLFRWLLRRQGTWDVRNHSDFSVNLIELSEIKNEIRNLQLLKLMLRGISFCRQVILKIMSFIYHSLPLSWRNYLFHKGIGTWIKSAFGVSSD